MDLYSACRIVPARGTDALVAARNQLLQLCQRKQASQERTIRRDGKFSPIVAGHRSRQGECLGVSFEDINTTLSTAFGSNYVNDFDSKGRQQRVIVQLEASERMTPGRFQEPVCTQCIRNHGTILGLHINRMEKRSNPADPVQWISIHAYYRFSC